MENTYLEQQKKEIKTIKERSITIKLSDADCERIFDLCGAHSITLSTLLENFIGDLVCGTYTNGSDERDYAQSYFNRCWFGSFKKTLLNYLLFDYGSDSFVDLLEDIEIITDDLKECEENPQNFDENEIKLIKNDFEECKNELEKLKKDFIKFNNKADWDKELAEVKRFIKEKRQFING